MSAHDADFKGLSLKFIRSYDVQKDQQPTRADAEAVRKDSAPDAMPRPPLSYLLSLAVDFLNSNFEPWTFNGSEPVAIELEELLRKVRDE